MGIHCLSSVTCLDVTGGGDFFGALLWLALTLYEAARVIVRHPGFYLGLGPWEQFFVAVIVLHPAEHQFACQRLGDAMKSQDNFEKLQACERLPLPLHTGYVSFSDVAG